MKTMGVEALLRWAYRDELPKDGAGMRLRDRPSGHGRPWDDVREAGQLLALVDEPNRWGVTPDLSSLCEPDPIAVVVGQAVAALDVMPVELPEGWAPLADIVGLDETGQGLLVRATARALDLATVVDAGGLRRLRHGPAWLVRRHAVMGGAPVWEVDAPEVRFEMAHGKPRWFVREVLVGADGPYEVELDGYDAKRKRPKVGAYRKAYLDPDPIEAASGRAEYEVWHAALDVLVEDLNAAFAARVSEVEPCERARWCIRVEPTRRPVQPWITGDSLERAVLEDAAAPVLSWPLGLWGTSQVRRLSTAAYAADRRAAGVH